jgi:hypothetical protein
MGPYLHLGGALVVFSPFLENRQILVETFSLPIMKQKTKRYRKLDTTLCLIAYLQDIGHDIRLATFKPWSNYLTVTYILNFKNYHHFEGAQRKHSFVQFVPRVRKFNRFLIKT